MNHYTVLALYFMGWTQKIPVSFWHICVHAQWRPSLQALGQQSTRLLCPWNFAGENTGVGSHFLLQEIFLTQGGLNSCLWCLLHWQADSFPLATWEALGIRENCAYPCLEVVGALGPALLLWRNKQLKQSCYLFPYLLLGNCNLDKRVTCLWVLPWHFPPSPPGYRNSDSVATGSCHSFTISMLSP